VALNRKLWFFAMVNDVKKYIQTFLLLFVALGVVIFAFGLGLMAVLSVMIALPILRFFLTRKTSQTIEAKEERIIEVEYEIIHDNPKEIIKKKSKNG
jgi:hypothetical protein